MHDLSSTILSLLEKSESTPLKLASILRSKQLDHLISKELLDLWLSGRVFASAVKLDGNEYVPEINTLWTIKQIDGYYGYNQNQGVFRVTQLGRQPTQLRLLATINVGQPLLSLAIAPNGDNFVIGGHRGSIWTGSIANALISNEIVAHEKRVWGVDYSSTGSQFLSCSEDGTLLLWTNETGENVLIGKIEDSITDVRFSPDGRHALTTQKVDKLSRNPTIRMWSLEERIPSASYNHHAKNAYTISYLPNGEGFISGGSDYTVAHWSFEEQQVVFQKADHDATVSCSDVTPDNMLAATGAWNGIIRLWNLETGKSTAIEAHNTRVLSVSFSKSGNLLASGSKDNQLAIWYMPEGSLVTMNEAHSGWVRDVAFAASDNVVVTVGTEGLCKIWSLE